MTRLERFIHSLTDVLLFICPTFITFIWPLVPQKGKNTTVHKDILNNFLQPPLCHHYNGGQEMAVFPSLGSRKYSYTHNTSNRSMRRKAYQGFFIAEPKDIVILLSHLLLKHSNEE